MSILKHCYLSAWNKIEWINKNDQSPLKKILKLPHYKLCAVNGLKILSERGRLWEKTKVSFFRWVVTRKRELQGRDRMPGILKHCTAQTKYVDNTSHPHLSGPCQVAGRAVTGLSWVSGAELQRHIHFPKDFSSPSKSHRRLCCNLSLSWTKHFPFLLWQMDRHDAQTQESTSLAAFYVLYSSPFVSFLSLL